MVHAERLEPDIADSPAFRRDRDNGGHYLERLHEGESESGVRGIHECVGAGLNLICPSVDRIGPCAAGGDDLSSNVSMRF